MKEKVALIGLLLAFLGCQPQAHEPRNEVYFDTTTMESKIQVKFLRGEGWDHARQEKDIQEKIHRCVNGEDISIVKVVTVRCSREYRHLLAAEIYYKVKDSTE